MYLQALEISNFKSFKGEITVPLDRGFTAITGPNGSGNRIGGDAIQFVLGPRSNKVIRAQNAKDLIFNGGKKFQTRSLMKSHLFLQIRFCQTGADDFHWTKNK